MDDSCDRFRITVIAEKIEQNLIMNFSDHFGHNVVDLNTKQILNRYAVNLGNVAVGLKNDS